MKKNILPLVIAILIAGNAFANPITSSKAQTVGTNFYKQNSAKTISTMSLVYTQTGTEGTPLYYVFNINANDGFVIVAADDASTPILGYNDIGHYDAANQPPNFAEWMNNYANEITYLKVHNIQPTADNTADWNAYLNDLPSRSTKHIASAVLPLSNIIWNQSPYFNALCPGGSVTGCCATAMAQVMQYWKYPAHGLLSNTYNENTPQYQENYGVLSRNFYTETFNWANMPDTINSPNADVAKLMLDCGISIDMNYSPSGSNAQVICPNSFSNQGADSVCDQTSYVKFFGYNRHTIHGYYKLQFSDSIWKVMLENELNNGRIVQYTGGGDIGHTWLCEGYNSSTQFYMNWGWGGSSNGYFALNGLLSNYDSLQQACIGIEPPAASAQFYANNVSVCTGSAVYFTDESLSPTHITSWNWSFPGGTPSTSTLQNPLVTYNTPGIYNAKLIITATGGGDTITKANYIVVQPDKNQLPLNETFESASFPPTGWYLNNPNDWNTSNNGYGSLWQRYSHTGGGGYGTSNSCLLFYNFNSGYREYLLNEPPPPNPIGGQNQQIYTPAYDFRQISKDSLTFDVAYAPYNTVYSDTLAIYYSLDCGITWTTIYYKGGMDLATTISNISATGDTLGFIPTSSQWRTETIQLPSAVYGQASVMFSFENRSYWGGQLYLDNINIPQGPTLSVNTISQPDNGVTLYPNPNNGDFTVSITNYELGITDVEVYNVLGEKIYSNPFTINNSPFTINLTGQPNGVYFYRIVSENRNLIGEGKMIIQK